MKNLEINGLVELNENELLETKGGMGFLPALVGFTVSLVIICGIYYWIRK